MSCIHDPVGGGLTVERADGAGGRQRDEIERVDVDPRAGVQAGIGHELVHNLVRGGFTGAVLPVNPHAGSIGGIHAYASVGDTPMPPDLAIIAVPAEHVAAVIAECGAAHVGGIVIISAGFAELGADGRAVEAGLVKSARKYGIRVIGPNCMGLANTDTLVRMNATFAPVDPIPGNVAFMTQSGALGISLIDESARRGIGISSFVSVGNKADISGNDLLRYWEKIGRAHV